MVVGPSHLLHRVLDVGGRCADEFQLAECSFSHDGTGTFKGGSGSDPFAGTPGERHSEPEKKLEVIFPSDKTNSILRVLNAVHPYEEVAYEIVSLENELQDVGSGMIGDLAEPMQAMDFLLSVKQKMNTKCIRHTKPVLDQVQRIAICGGSGSFLLEDAVRSKADVFITGDYKYHQFFDADSRIIIADIGHYESEQFTPELILEILYQKFGNFALHLSKVETNPINYL